MVIIFAAKEGTDTALIQSRLGGGGFGPSKEALAEILVAKLSPIANETQHLLADTAHLQSILREGAAKANALAEPIVKEAEKIVGFLS